MANRPSNRDRNTWTVDLLNVQPGDRVMEIGCGPGIALEACLKQAVGGQVVGLDHSRTMLGQARSRNAQASRNGYLELRLGSLEELVESTGSFDKVCSANVVQFFADRGAAFDKIFRLLKPKGISATTFMPRSKNASRSDSLKMAKHVSRDMEAAGFANIRVEELPLSTASAVCIIGERL